MRWTSLLVFGFCDFSDSAECTFNEYGEGYDNSNTGCLTAQSCTSAVASKAGVPTFYGSVYNEPNEIVTVSPWDPSSPTSTDFDTSTFKISGIEAGTIRICKHNFPVNNNAEAGSCTAEDNSENFAQEPSDSHPNSQNADYFEISGNKIVLKKIIDMKWWGGPRHELILNTEFGCTVRLVLFVSPKKDGVRTTPEVSLLNAEDDFCLIANLEVPTCSISSNGIPMDFQIDEFDNILCLYEEKASAEGFYPVNSFYDVTDMEATFGAITWTMKELPRIEGPMAYFQSQLSDAINNFNSYYKPGQSKCSFSVFGAIELAEAVQYEDLKQSDVTITMTTVGRVNLRYTTGTKNQADIAQQTTAVGGSFEQNAVSVQDVDDMPPLFDYEDSCTDEKLSAGGQCYPRAASITIDFEDCKTRLLKINSLGDAELDTDITVRDGDIGLNLPVSINVETGEDFTWSSPILKCTDSTPLGQHVINITAAEVDNKYRYSSMSVVVNVVREYDLTSMIIPPSSDKNYSVSGYGPDFVRDEDENIMKIETQNVPDGAQVKFVANDNDFAIDNLGRVIYVGSSNSRATRSSLKISVFLTGQDGDVLDSNLDFDISVEIDEIDIETTTAAETTIAPETTATPETTVAPETSAVPTEADTTTAESESSTSSGQETTKQPEPTTEKPAETTKPPDNPITDVPPECEEDDLFFILTIVFSVLSGVLIIVIIILACNLNKKDDDEFSNDDWSEKDKIEMRKTRKLDSASIESDSGIVENIPMPRPDVNINHDLVKTAAVVGFANSAFNEDSGNTSQSSKPEVVEPASPVVEAKKPEPEVTLVPIKPAAAAIAVATVASSAEKKDVQLDPATINYKLKNPLYHTLSDYEISMKGMIKVGKISSSRECSLRNTRDNELKNAVAVTLNAAGATDSQFQEITKRILIYNDVSKMKHDNILKFYGTWVEGDLLHLGFEFAERGKLSEHLRSTRQMKSGTNMSTMTNYQILKLLSEIAQGLSHLHQRNIIHGNLQGSTVYLTDENIPKISGMLNNRIKLSNKEVTRWWAPEVFTSEKQTKEADIWSFGVLMWEVCTFGGLPYSNIGIDEIQDHIKYDRLPMPSNVASDIYAHMVNCWKKETRDRPDSHQIVMWLQERLISDNSNSFKRAGRDFVHEPTEPKAAVKTRPVKVTSVYKDTATNSSAF